MHSSVLWLLSGLGVVAFVVWRLTRARRVAQALRASREAAMAIALAEAHKAARTPRPRHETPEAPARQPPAGDAPDSLPLITRTVARPGPTVTPKSPQARAEAERIAHEAVRRARDQRQALVEAERRPPPAPAPIAEPAPVTRLAPRPAAPQAKAPVAATPPAAPRIAKTPAQTLILVVDDSKMVRIKTSRLLEAHAYQVATAVDGLDAVRQLENCRPDLVITDVDMPGLDGFGLTRFLRGNAGLADLPIVMITSAEDRHRDDAQRAGVGLVLGKPYPEEALIEHIRSHRFEAAPSN